MGIKIVGALTLVGIVLGGAAKGGGAESSRLPVATAPPAALLPSQKACAVLRDAPRSSVPVVVPATRTCAMLEGVRAALPLESTLANDALQKLRDDIDKAVTAEPEACAVSLAKELASSTSCGLVYDAVAIRIMNGKGVDPALAAGLLREPSVCQWKLISALREAQRAELAVVAAVLDLTVSADADVQKAAWMTLGTLGRIARDAAQADVSECVGGVLAPALAASKGEQRHVLTESAGNAGCEACRPTLSEMLRSTDPQVRRASVTAHRFLVTSADVGVLCDALLHDPEPQVRGTAAFALKHSVFEVERRLTCLAEAAITERSEPVASDAIAAISDLATRSDLGEGVLVHVMKNAAQPAARAYARRDLGAFATEEAIEHVLKTP